MKFRSVALFCSMALLASACQNASTINHNTTTSIIIDTSKIEEVSLINLIATPEKFDGRKVRIIGYLHIEFEGNVICLNKEDYTHGISKNSLWMDFKSRNEMAQFKKCSDHYVITEGIFNAKMQGHMGMNSGSIQNISRLEIWK